MTPSRPLADLDEGDPAVTCALAAAVDAPDGHLAVVLHPALAAQDVVDAGRDLVPLVVLTQPAGGAHTQGQSDRTPSLFSVCVCVCGRLTQAV